MDDEDFTRDLRASLRRMVPDQVPSRLQARVDHSLATQSNARASGRTSLRAFSGAASALVTVAIVAVLGVLFVGRPLGAPAGSPSATQSTEPTGFATGSPSISEIPSTEPATAIDWVRSSQPAGVILTTAIQSGSGFLAFASDLAAGGSAQLWESADGLYWQPRPTPAAFAPAGSSTGMTVVAGVEQAAGFLVAVGTEQAADSSSGQAAAWFSTDGGLTWARALGQGMSDATMTAVTAGPAGWVAVGSDGYPGASSSRTGSRGMAVWHSTDGRSWARVAGSAALRGSSIPDQIVSGGFGYLAGGQVSAGHSDAAPLWSSADGSGWTRVRGVSVTSSHLARGQGASEVILVGDTSGGPVIWSSTDGKSWSAASLTPPPTTTMSLDAVGLASSVWVAAGVEVANDGTPHINIWLSADTVTWHQTAADPSFASSSAPLLIRGDGKVLIVAQAYDLNAALPHGYVWVGTPRRP